MRISHRYSIVFDQFVLQRLCEFSRETWQRRLTVCVERESRRVSDAEHYDEDTSSLRVRYNRAGHVTLVLGYVQVPTYEAV